MNDSVALLFLAFHDMTVVALGYLVSAAVVIGAALYFKMKGKW